MTGLTLLGNNFQNWITDGGPFSGFPGIAPIWLGVASQNNTVIGGSNSTNVFDEGANNTLTGVNNMGMNIGQEIHDAMLQEMEAKRFRLEIEAAFP